MESHAIVIGIDGYDPAIGKLDGAVHDALSFAAWVTGPGGVPAANLRLLLGPDPAAPPPVLPAGVAGFSPASNLKIREDIETLREALPAGGGERLYFYYAGHGASIPEWQEDPFLIPPEFVKPKLHGLFLLGFKDLFQSLGELPFAEQVCLIDACRDFGLEGYEPVIPSGVRRRLTERKALQYVLYSVAPGQKAAETGQGIWTRTLLDGLTGRDYRPVTRGTGRESRYEVRLDDLADWVRREVARRIETKFLRDAARYVQTPQYERDKQGEDPVLATFTRDTVPRARLRVFVDPSLAHSTCKVSVLQYVDGLGEEIPVTSSPPPLRVPAQFELRPSDYSIQAEAERFVVGRFDWTVLDDPTVRLTLDAVPSGPAAPETEVTRGGPLSYGVAATRSGGSGTLNVSSPDAAALIEVLGARRTVVHQAVGDVRADLPPGLYRVRLSLPGTAPSEQSVRVLPGQETRVQPSPPASRLGAPTVTALRSIGIDVFEETGGQVTLVRPEETLGNVAGARLASLLAFAAYAAQRRDARLEKLLRVGVRPAILLAPETSALLVLIASSAPAIELGRFLGDGRIVVRRRDGKILYMGGFEPLAGMPVASQRLVTFAEPGALVAEIHLPGFAPTRYSIAALPGRVSILIAAAEMDGSVEVQQYLLPAPGIPPVTPPEREYLDQLPTLRRLEMAQSFYAAGRQEQALAAASGGKSLRELLRGKWLDPLLGCLAGYVLAGSGRPEELLDPHSDVLQVLADPEGEVAAAARERGPDHSALRNLLVFFPGLPDVHVLAGLCDPVEARRPAHFQRAAQRGLPIFAEGARALATWTRQEGGNLGYGLDAAAGFLPGPWTAWTISSTKDQERG